MSSPIFTTGSQQGDGVTVSHGDMVSMGMLLTGELHGIHICTLNSCIIMICTTGLCSDVSSVYNCTSYNLILIHYLHVIE